MDFIDNRKSKDKQKVGFVRARDIREKEREIKCIQGEMEVAGYTREEYDEMKCNLDRAKNELKSMKERYAEYEGMFSELR